MIRFVLVVFLFSAFLPQAFSQVAVEKSIQQFMQNGNIPGLFMAVVKGNQVLYQKTTGYADREKRTPVKPTTCFELGSISKAFVGDLIYELHQQNKLNVQDPITNYFPGAPANWSSVTLAHLLGHTSGIQNYLSDPRFYAAAYFTNRADTNAERFFTTVSTDSMIKLFFSLPLEFSPGSSWSYSNTGFILLGKIAEMVTGQPFFQLVRSKLSSLSMQQTLANEEAASKGCLAKGYFMAEGKRRVARTLSSSYAFSAGAWATTGTDMVHFLKAIHRKGLPIDQAGYEWRDVSSFSALPFSYQGGRFYTTYHGLKIIFHNGGTPGFSSSWIYVPEKNISIIVLINRQDYAPIDQLAWEVLAAFEPALKFPTKRIQNPDAQLHEAKAKQFLTALQKDTMYTEGFSGPLRLFMAGENGKGLWRWIFERGIPTQAYCVDEENIDGWRLFRFRLPMRDRTDSRLTFVVSPDKEITQIIWY